MSLSPVPPPAPVPSAPTGEPPARVARVSTWAGLRRRWDEDSIGFDVRAHIRFTISKHGLFGLPRPLAATAILYVLCLVVGYTSFDPIFTWVFPRENLGALLYSHLALVSWLAACVTWLRYWMKQQPALVPAFSLAGWLTFAALGVLGLYLYTPGDVFLAGDMAHNATHTIGIATGHNLYAPWVNHSGWGKQSFMFYLLAPLFRLFWPEYESLPVQVQALCVLACIAATFFLMRQLRVHMGIALAVCTAMMAAPILYWPQDYFIPRNVTGPAFILLNLVLLRGYLLETDPERKPAWAAFFGLSIGFGFNIYDTNYIVGAALMAAFVVRVLAELREGWPVVERRLRLAFASALIGTGPLLLCQLKADVVGSRLNGGAGDATSPLRDLHYVTQTLSQYFQEVFAGTLPTEWLYVKIALVGLGLIVAVRRGPWYFWVVIAGLVALFVAIAAAEPSQGIRRTLQLVYFEFLFLAVLFDALYRRLGRLALLPAFGLMAWTALWGGEQTYARVRRPLQNADHGHQVAYERFIAAHRHVPDLYVIEPNLAPNALMRSGGRLEIFDIVSAPRGGRLVWATDNSRDISWEEKQLRMDARLARLARTGEPFVFCFWVDGSDWFHWPQPERTHEIRQMEGRFLSSLSRYGMSDVLRYTFGAAGSFMVRAYVRAPGLSPARVEVANAP